MPDFKEFNPNHHPAGSPIGGQFAPSRQHTVGITSARDPKKDPAHYRPNRDVAKEMHRLANDLRALPGVSRVSVRPAHGQWKGGMEFSWAVSYDGNGAARRRIAKVGKEWNQDGIMFLTKLPAGQKGDTVSELRFPSVPMAARTYLEDRFADAGLQGWTWYKDGRQTVFRAASVPAWGGTNRGHRLSMEKVIRAFREAGLRPTRVNNSLRYRAEAFEPESRPGVLSYAEVMRGR